MYTLERIKNEFDAALASQGVKRNSKIELNPRLRTCLGRVMYHYNSQGGFTPFEVQFSKNYIESATDENIHQTILHEAAHYIVAKQNPAERHQHDATFRAMCAELGCTFNRAKTNVEYTEQGLKSMQSSYKYFIYCKDCGKLVAQYKTKCKTVQHPEYYTCGCCGGALEVR